MCSECMMTPCDSRCPNAPDPVHVFECELCEGGICYGEDFVEINGRYYHVDCLDVQTLLELVDIDIEIALGEESW